MGFTVTGPRIGDFGVATILLRSLFFSISFLLDLLTMVILIGDEQK